MIPLVPPAAANPALELAGKVAIVNVAVVVVPVAAAEIVICVPLTLVAIVAPAGMFVPTIGAPTSPVTKAAVAEVTVVLRFVVWPSVTVRAAVKE